MAPVVVAPEVSSTTTALEQLKIVAKETVAAAPGEATYPREPLKLAGVLDKYEQFDVTPVLGREFPTIQIREVLNAPNADELIRDIAITVSQRNVVFFRKQELTNLELKTFVQKLGELTGKPKESGLHIHPIINADRDAGGEDNEISRISTELKNIYKVSDNSTSSTRRQTNARLWHSDITFEPVPTDYSALHIVELPASGGDTLWASGYEAYDRLSTPFQKFYEGLTGTYAQPGFTAAAARGGFAVYDKPRGHPDNVGTELSAVHPIIRTNPVTGWKSIFALGVHVSKVNDVTDVESARILKNFTKLVTENHDLQVRFKWGKNDLAVWDNRSTYHSGTRDLANDDIRIGNRAVSIAEKPYFDANSQSRREALGQTVPSNSSYV